MFGFLDISEYFKISKPLVSQYVEDVIVHATAGLQVGIRVGAENI